MYVGIFCRTMLCVCTQVLYSYIYIFFSNPLNSDKIKLSNFCICRFIQASPWNSPRIMSPVDARHILGSRSTENLRLFDNYALESNFGTPLRRKSSSRSLRKKSPQPGEHRLSVSQSNQDMEEFEKINHPSLLNR